MVFPKFYATFDGTFDERSDPMLAPCSPRAPAIFRPNPRDPPVTNATFPERSNTVFTLPSAILFAVKRAPIGWSASLENRGTAFDKRLDAFHHVLTVEDPVLDLRNVINRN